MVKFSLYLLGTLMILCSISWLGFMDHGTSLDQRLMTLPSFKHAAVDSITANSLVIFDLVDIDREMSAENYVAPVVMQKELSIDSIISSDMVKQLQARGVAVVVSTDIKSNGFRQKGVFGSGAEWLYQYLKSVGFEGSFHEHMFNHHHYKKVPVFYKGILVSGYLKHGPALDVFLDTIGMRPAKVILVHNQQNYRRYYEGSIDLVCSRRNIEFERYTY
jgi:hypothetical protein